MSIFVKVIRIPGAVKEVGLQEGATVADALAAAEFQVSPTETITLNGTNVNTSTPLNDGDRLVLAKEAKSA